MLIIANRLREELDQPKIEYSIFHEVAYWAKRANKMLHEWISIPYWSRADFIATCIVEDASEFIANNREKIKQDWFTKPVDTQEIAKAISEVEDFFDG